jgi:hypothetical protein
MLGMIHQEQQSHIASCGEAQGLQWSMVNGIPVEDAVAHLQLELQMIQSWLRSDAASVAGHTFESYEDTFKWVVAHCSADDWKHVMDMPSLYSDVRPDGPVYDTLLVEESNSSNAGYASSAQARLALSFKTKVPGIFGGEKFGRNEHPFAAADLYDKWVSKDTQKGFWDQVEV